MDLRDLNYFQTIAELGHLGRASQKLNRSQPALSQSIQRLEDSLGAKLFQRDGRGIKLTPVGEILQVRAKLLQQAVMQTRREVRDYASGTVGHIRLGCAASVAMHLLPKITTPLLAVSPEITLNIVIGQDDLLRESLRNEQLDIIVCGWSAEGDDFDGFPIFRDEGVVIASRNHPIFESEYSIRDLCEYRWVLPSATVSSRHWLNEVFRAEGLPPPVVQIESNSIALLPSLIENSPLLSFTARESLINAKNMQDLREVALPHTTMKRFIGCTVKRGAYLSPAAHELLRILRDVSANNSLRS